MNNKHILGKIIIGFLIFTATLFVADKPAQAQTRLAYPIPELSFCRDAKECYLYCEIPHSKPSCWSYGKYVLGSQVLGEETENTDDIEMEAKRKNIAFPVAELGNCSSLKECKDYCDSPENKEACMAFADKHGLKPKKPRDEKKQKLLEEAKEALGCNSREECDLFCQENKDQCAEFIKQHDPEEYERFQKQKEMVESAQEKLNCHSMEECKNFCQKPENQEKCGRFADEHAPKEFQERKEQILENAKETFGCISIEKCKRFCENPENKDKCRDFNQKNYLNDEHRPPPPPEGESLQEKDIPYYQDKPTCETEEECRHFCEENPDKCPGFREAEEQRRLEEETRLERDNIPESFPQTPETREPRQDYPALETKPTFEAKPILEAKPEYYQQEYIEEEQKYEVNDPGAFCIQKGCRWDGSLCHCTDGSFSP